MPICGCSVPAQCKFPKRLQVPKTPGCPSAYAKGARPKPPWHLFLVFNKGHKTFELLPEHFTPDGENLSESLIATIKGIDPGYQVGSGGELTGRREPLAIDVATKEKLKIWPDRLSVMDMMRNVGKPRERTFSDVLDEVFGLRDA